MASESTLVVVSKFVNLEFGGDQEGREGGTRGYGVVSPEVRQTRKVR